MALNLPTPGESSRLNPMRVPGAVKPKTFHIGVPGGKKGGGGGGGAGAPTGNDPYSPLMLRDPYDPKTISQAAQTGYNQDVANAQRLASMGFPTNDQLAAQAQTRSANVNSVYQDLANHLAGVQQAGVAQGNAGSAALGAQNAAASATMPNIPGAPTASSPIPTPAVQAVLAAQTAAAGNYGGDLQRASLSAGAQGAQRALDAGSVAQQDNNNSIQRQLASLLSGVSSQSSRESDMYKQNQSVDAANIQSKLSVWQQLQSNSQLDKQLGNKLKSQQEGEAAAQLLAGLNNDAANYRAGLGAQTSLTNARLGAETSTGNSDARIRADAWQKDQDRKFKAAQAKLDRGVKLTVSENALLAKRGVKAPKGYQVTVLLPQTTAYDPNTGKTKIVPAKRVSKSINAAVWNKFNASGPMGKRKLAILGVPEGSKIQSSVAKS